MDSRNYQIFFVIVHSKKKVLGIHTIFSIYTSGLRFKNAIQGTTTT